MKYSGLAYDSRKVKPGDAFVAIPGLKVDGAKFIPQAIKNGAGVVVAEKEVKVPEGVEFQKVPSARKALAHLADQFYGHPSKKVKLIGITGTNGKTTIAYLIESILKTAGFKVGLIGTVGARIDGRQIPSELTTPESLELQAMLAQMVEQNVTHVVMEVSSHALALDRVYDCDFDMAIFTNLTHDHLDFHKDMKGYLEAKKKLFANLKPEGVAIINVDDPASHLIMETVKGEIITYGLTQAKRELRSTKQNEFETNVENIFVKPDEMSLTINSFEIRTPLIGVPNAYNIVAAYQCGLTFGIDQRTIKKGIEGLKAVPGRFELIDCGQAFTVVVDFAHSPDSLQKLIETYRPLTEGKIILLFGCPGDRDKEKRPIMGKIAVELADEVIVTTDDPHGEDAKGIIEEIVSSLPSTELRASQSPVTSLIDRKKAIEKALKMAKKGDTVLIAGRGHEKFQDFNGKKVALDDRDVARHILTSQLS